MKKVISLEKLSSVQLKQRIIQLQSEVRDCHRRIESYKRNYTINEIEQMRKENESLRLKFEEFLTKYEEKESELIVAMEKMKDAQARTELYHTKYHLACTTYDEAKKTWEKERSVIEEKCKFLTCELSEAQSENEKHKQEYSEAEKTWAEEKGRMQKHYEMMCIQLKDTEKEKKRLNIDLNEARSVKDTIKEEHSEAEKSWGNEIESLQKQYKMLSGQLKAAEAEKVKQSYSKAEKAWNKEKESLQKQYEMAGSQLKAAEAEKEKVKQSYSEAEKAWSKEKESLQKQYEMVGSQLKAAEAEKEKVKQSYSEAEKAWDQEKADFLIRQVNTKELENEIALLKVELKSTKGLSTPFLPVSKAPSQSSKYEPFQDEDGVFPFIRNLQTASRQATLPVREKRRIKPDERDWYKSRGNKSIQTEAEKRAGVITEDRRKSESKKNEVAAQRPEKQGELNETKEKKE
ncbi:hypothetical protein JSY36_09830 [Bacillus sp. H-16]|uniref:hypothetical protein n=1 Tax=Alteribacter salitolerans TaxID=2912333 RepID=UPI001965EA1A|nr:hypothetical protein [Alteribacter salitolerans]MBM7096054.1 hypothetical protein [Alteribacter salitolerans]